MKVMSEIMKGHETNQSCPTLWKMQLVAVEESLNCAYDTDRYLLCTNTQSSTKNVNGSVYSAVLDWTHGCCRRGILLWKDIQIWNCYAVRLIFGWDEMNSALQYTGLWATWASAMSFWYKSCPSADWLLDRLTCSPARYDCPWFWDE